MSLISSAFGFSKPTPPDLELLTVSEVAAEMRCSFVEVNALIENGSLPAADVCFGRHSVPVPRSFIADLAREIGWTEGRLWARLAEHRRSMPQRAGYRIPRKALREFGHRIDYFEVPPETESNG